MIEDTSNSTLELFVNELRKSYDLEWQIKDILENKANNILTISGTVATLLFGFGALFLKNLNPNYQFLGLFISFLMTGIITSIAAIITSSLSFRLRLYGVPMDTSIFDDNKNLIDEYKAASRDAFNSTMIDAYITSIHQNNQSNKDKVKFISTAQWLFIASMAMIPILLSVVIHAIQVKAITFPISV